MIAPYLTRRFVHGSGQIPPDLITEMSDRPSHWPNPEVSARSGFTLYRSADIELKCKGGFPEQLGILRFLRHSGKLEADLGSTAVDSLSLWPDLSYCLRPSNHAPDMLHLVIDWWPDLSKIVDRHLDRSVPLSSDPSISTLDRILYHSLRSLGEKGGGLRQRWGEGDHDLWQWDSEGKEDGQHTYTYYADRSKVTRFGVCPCFADQYIQGFWFFRIFPNLHKNPDRHILSDLDTTLRQGTSPEAEYYE